MVAFAVVVLAIILVFLGGSDKSASQLYYDADFVELYDTEELDEMAELDAPKKATVQKVDDAEDIPTTLEGEVDPRMLSEEIYKDINL